MYSIKKLLQVKLFYYMIAIFISVLVVFNISIFVLSNIQYNNETKRQYESLTNMVSHLSAQEDQTVLEAYLEHYVHTNNIIIVFIDSQDNIVFDNDTSQDLNLFNDLYYNDQYVGKISTNFENSSLSRDYSIGFLIINIASIILFTTGSYILFQYVKKQNNLLYEDFNHMMSTSYTFSFKETDKMNDEMIKLMEQETKQKQLYVDYVRSLAHDIKTPLTVLFMYLEAFRNNKIKNDNHINEEMMIELNKIESLVPKFIEFDIKQIAYKQDISTYIEKFVSQYQDVFDIKQIKISTQLEPLIVEIADLDVSRIIEHLVYNAFYYSKPEHEISIYTSSENRTLIIKDQGIGMNQSTIDKLMNGPYRSKEAITLHHKGSGIGYQIILSIMKKLNGKVLIESKIDQGTKVTLLFK